jgi:hypothetical protein
MTIKNFKEFMLFESESQSQEETQPEKGEPILHLIKDIEYNNPEIEWFMTIDIKDIWDQYKSKSLSFEDFTKQYNERLLAQKTELEKISPECWNSLVEKTNQVGEYDDEKANKYFNKIYDWGDEFGVKINVGEQPQVQNQPQTQTQPVQNQPQPQTQPPVQNNEITL